MFARMKTFSMVLCLVVVCLTLSATAMASDSDKKTIITTNQPLEIPGQVVLPAGKYVMKLADLGSSRNVVQVFNADETKLYATVMGIPDYRPEAPEKPEISLYETKKGNPYAIREWFYRGSNYGIEFPGADRASKYASDSTIKSIVERNLEKRHLTPKNGAKIRVAVDDHVITLSGTVPSLKLMREAEEQARHAGNGVLVENHLSVADVRKSDEQLAQEVPVLKTGSGPVDMHVGFVVSRARNWTTLWKPAIDSLGGILGMDDPRHPFRPRDDRIVRLAFHRTIDDSVGWNIHVGFWWRDATAS